MLHTINKSPYTNTSLESCLGFINEGDSVLLYEDGVLGAQAGSSVEPILKDFSKKCKIYVLSEDLKARGISNTLDFVELTDYSGFVDLVEKDKILAWL